MSNEDRRNSPARADLVAAKLARIKNFEEDLIALELEKQPRYFEVLWFLQWASEPENYAGGLRRFASDLIEESKSQLATAEMIKIGPCAQYTSQQEKRVRCDIPGLHQSDMWQLTKRADRELYDFATEIETVCVEERH